MLRVIAPGKGPAPRAARAALAPGSLLAKEIISPIANMVGSRADPP